MKNILLLFVSIFLFWLLYPLGLVYALITLRFRISAYCRAIAISIDQLGNVVLSALMNDILITKKTQTKFGDVDMTISEVLGWNVIADTLTPAGQLIVNILDKIDKGHCINAIKQKE